MSQFIPNKLSDSITVDHIYTIHYFKYMKDFRFTGESHNFWELVYIDAGEAEIIADDRSFMLSQGNAVFHAPNEYHNIATNNKFANSVIVTFECDQPIMDFFVGRTVEFSEEEKLLLRLIVSEGSLNFNDKLNDLYLQKMSKKENPPFGGEQIIKNALEMLLISVIRNASDVETPKSRNATSYIWTPATTSQNTSTSSSPLSLASIRRLSAEAYRIAESITANDKKNTVKNIKVHRHRGNMAGDLASYSTEG